MTDLIERPEDTGDIPTVGEKTVRIVGERTENLAPYAAGLRPKLRRGDAELTREIPVYEPAGFTYLDTATGTRPAAVLGLVADLTPPGLPQAEPEATYVGRHRAPEDMPAEVPPGRFGWLRSVLSAAVQRIKAAL